MGQLIGMLLGVVAILAVTLGLFVGVNALVDLAPRNFGLFATLAGAVIGAVVGVIVNSGGWFLGGLLWPLGGAVLGALVGGLVWAKHPPPPERRWRIPDKLRPAIFLGPGAAVPVRRPGRSHHPHDLPELPQPAGRRARGPARTTADLFGDSTIFNVDNVNDIWSSRLFVAGAVIAVVALVLVIVRGVGTRRGVDLSAPTPVISLTAAAILVTLAVMSALRGVIWNNLFWVDLRDRDLARSSASPSPCWPTGRAASRWPSR